MEYYGNLTNRMMESSVQSEPSVGMGATECWYSDRHAYTVIAIKSKTRILVQRDEAKRVDDNGMSDCQTYEYSADPKGQIKELIKTKKGWKEYKGCNRFLLGVRSEYYDYTF